MRAVRRPAQMYNGSIDEALAARLDRLGARPRGRTAAVAARPDADVGRGRARQNGRADRARRRALSKRRAASPNFSRATRIG